MLCVGKISPPNREGIIKKKCRLLAFDKIEQFTRKKRKEGTLIEGYIDAALALLKCQMI